MRFCTGVFFGKSFGNHIQSEVSEDCSDTNNLPFDIVAKQRIFLPFFSLILSVEDLVTTLKRQSSKIAIYAFQAQPPYFTPYFVYFPFVRSLLILEVL